MIEFASILKRVPQKCVLLGASALMLCASLQAQDQPVDLVRIKVDPKMVLAPISSNFIGFVRVSQEFAPPGGIRLYLQSPLCVVWYLCKGIIAVVH